MAINVGRLIKEGNVVNEKLLSQIEDIINQITSYGIIKDFEYNKIRDPRINSIEWKSILHTDILYIYKWALKRIIYSQINQGNSKINRIVCFQPYYGVCLHYVRRVLPFALLGFEVTVVFSDEYFKESINIVKELNHFLGITNIQFINKTNVNELEDRFDQIFLITGKKRTFDFLHTKFNKTTIVGALGEQAILISKQLGLIHHKFSRIEPSCTNVNYSLTLADNCLIDNIGAKYSFDYILELNPTIIYTDMEIQNINPFNLYKVITFTEIKTLQLEGICADPKHGYPGDYLI